MRITLTPRLNMQFDQIARSIHRMNITSLSHAAGRTRLIARRSIRKMVNKNLSAPIGTPAYTHPSHIYGSAPLRSSIKYEIEKENELAVIGVSYRNLLDIGYAHEIGGWYKMKRFKKAQFYPKRPFMLPALNKVIPDLPKSWEGRFRK